MSRSRESSRRGGARGRERPSLVGAVLALARGMLTGVELDEARQSVRAEGLNSSAVYRRSMGGVLWLLFTELANERHRKLPSGAFAGVCDTEFMGLGGEDALLRLAGEAGAREVARQVESCVSALRAEAGEGRSEHELIGAMYEELLELAPALHRRSDISGFELVLTRTKGNTRKASGSYFTPSSVVAAVLESALVPVMDEVTNGKHGDEAVRALLRLRVCDPSCGVGHVLVGVVRKIAMRIAEIRGDVCDVAIQNAAGEVTRACVYGVDINPLSVELCRMLLWLQTHDDGAAYEGIAQHTRCADALLGAPVSRVEIASEADAEAWCKKAYAGVQTREAEEQAAEPRSWFHWTGVFAEVWREGDGFDAVVGNPPFLNQLESVTATERRYAAFLRARFDDAVRGYTDLSAAFLVLGVELCRPKGRVALVQPRSVLAAKDAACVRARIESMGEVESVWLPGERVFAGAMVQTCVPAIRVRSQAVQLEEAPTSTWARFAADAAGVPIAQVESVLTLAEYAEATADFRDQYYGLAGCIVEDETLPGELVDRERRFPRLITSGLIELAESRWGKDVTRVLKAKYLAPRVDRERLIAQSDLGAWVRARLVPKVLVATQTPVIEVVVDERGEWLPSVPVISVVPRETGMLWHVAAAIASPVCAAIAAREYAGTAMSPGAIKLSARQVVGLPVPARGEAWDQAVEYWRTASCEIDRAERAAALRKFAAASLEAYGVLVESRETLLHWWLGRARGLRGQKSRRDKVPV